MNPSAPLLFATLFVVAAVLAGPVLAIDFALRRCRASDERLPVIAPLVGLGLLGYAAFFAVFLAPVFGRIFAITVAVAAWGFVGRQRWLGRTRFRRAGIALPALAAAGLALFYLALLYLPRLGHVYQDQASFRFVHPLPMDAVLPEIFGDRLYDGGTVRPFLGDWLSSDRPPLQTGLYLLVLPWLRLARLPDGLGYQCLGTLAQLFWVPAVWLLARAFGQSRFRAIGCILVVAIVGFFVENSIFVWPKLLAGGYVMFTGLLLLDTSQPRTTKVMLLAAVSAALAWLAHGGAAFSLLALVPLWLWQRCPARRTVPLALAACALLALPWLLYQRFYDPPGDRLLKWHLAGVIPVDPRSLWTLLRSAYGSLTWHDWIAAKQSDLATIFGGSFGNIFNIFTTPVHGRRSDEFFHLARAISTLNLAWLFWPVAWLLRRRLHAGSPADSAATLGHFALRRAIAAWTFVTLVVWIGLLFAPHSTVLHHSPYAVMIALCSLAACLILEFPVWLAVVILAWHGLYFAATWLPYFGSAPLNRSMFVVFLAALAPIVVALRFARVDDRQ